MAAPLCAARLEIDVERAMELRDLSDYHKRGLEVKSVRTAAKAQQAGKA